MFYDIYAALCKQHGKSPSAVAQELGINKSNVTNWKNNGYTPRGNVLNLIAEYFGVPIDYLLGASEQKEKSSSKQEKDITFDDFTYAMYGAGQTLTEEQKQTLLDMARFLQSQNEQKDKP